MVRRDDVTPGSNEAKPGRFRETPVLAVACDGDLVASVGADGAPMVARAVAFANTPARPTSRSSNDR